MFKCCDCGTFFKEEEADFRPAVLEDGLRPTDKVMVCPVCGCDELDEDSECGLCGERFQTRSSGLCENCEREVDEIFEESVVHYLATKWDLSTEQVREEVLDYLCI